MDWYSFMFGLVSGLFTVLAIGAVIFFVTIRPYVKSVRKMGKRGGSRSSHNVPPEDLWLRQAFESNPKDTGGNREDGSN